MGIRDAVRALEHRNFRLFFFGQAISLCGTWLQQVAMTWLVWKLTESPAMLGVVNFAGQIPTFFLSPIAGVLSEGWDRRRALLVTQSLAMTQALLLAVLTLTGVIRVEFVMVLGVCLGIVNAFDLPIRQAFLRHMIDRADDLPNAIALNSSMVNGARLVGPALAGVLISLVGEGWCFLFNGLSYIAVLMSLAAMRVLVTSKSRERGKLWSDLSSGFAYAYRFAPVRALLLMLTLMSMTSMALSVLLPVLATERLHGDSGTLSLLMSSAGVGALGSAIYLASRRSIVGLGRQIGWACAGFGVGVIALAGSHSLSLSMALLTVTGFCTMLLLAATNTMLQTIVDEDKRGRVMGLYAMSFMGVTPFGSLTAGYLATWLGTPTTLVLNGLACLIGAGLFFSRLPALRQEVRVIYQRLGILPEIATGLQTSTQLNVPPQQ